MRFLALSVALGLGCLCAAGPSRADIWPAGHERIVRAFASGDDAERRGAASKLLELPAATARELAVRGLDDPDLDVRLLSAHAAATLRIPGLGDRVVGWLAETDVRLRTAACEVIDASPTPASVTALGRVLSDTKAEVRRAAAAAMGASGLPLVVEPLLGHLDDVEVVVRLEVVRALGRVGDARAVLPLVAKIQDTEAEVRRSAVRALGDLGDGRAVATLMLALQDTAPAVRLQALDALGRLHAEQAVTAIAALLAEDHVAGGVAPELLREAALVALGRIATPEAVKLLVDELEHESPSDEPGPVARAIALAGPRAVAALRAALDASSSRVLAAGAAAALAALGAREALPSLERAIERGAVPVAAGFRALALLGDAEALPFALARLDDPDPQVRALAIDVAGKLVRPSDADGRAVDPVVPRLLDLETPLAERVALAALLGRTGSPRALDPLVALAKARQPALRLAALRALGALGQSSPGADTVLIEALADGSEEVRTAAATALSRVARDDAAHALLTQLEVAAEQDRGAIGLALSGALAHSTDPGLVATVQAALPRAPAAARDTLIEGLGRMRVEAAQAALAELALAADADDRRKVAEALGGQAAASPALQKLLADPDPRVRASAAWSLGRVGDAASVAALVELLQDPDAAVAGNAAVASARSAARANVGAEAAPALCGALADGRSYVRANALVGLRLLGRSCAGDVLRQLVLRDEVWRVRAAAADLLHEVAAGTAPALATAPPPTASPPATSPAAEPAPASAGAPPVPPPEETADLAARTLRRCAAEDRDATVAAHCRTRALGTPSAGGGRPGGDLTVFVVPDGGTEPVPRAPFALELADGSLRLGVADRRGALFELAAPAGEVRLAVPAALAP